MVYSVKIKLLRQCNSKLAFIKVIKEICGIGLQNAKDIVDELVTIPFKEIEIKVENISFSEIDEKLMDVSFDPNYDDEFAKPYVLSGGTAYERDKKILQLGLGTKEDYKEFIFDSIDKKVVYYDQILNFVLDKLSKEDLLEIINYTNN